MLSWISTWLCPHECSTLPQVKPYTGSSCGVVSGSESALSSTAGVCLAQSAVNWGVRSLQGPSGHTSAGTEWGAIFFSLSLISLCSSRAPERQPWREKQHQLLSSLPSPPAVFLWLFVIPTHSLPSCFSPSLKLWFPGAWRYWWGIYLPVMWVSEGLPAT